MKSTLLGLAFVLVAVPAFAQATDKAQQADSRWSSWLGCWELVNEDVRQGARAGAIPLQSLVDGRPRICVTPAPDGGARFETTVGDRPAVEYTIVANGMDRPLSDSDCRGTQRAEWSEDGLRVFARAELTCAEDRGPRRVSSLALIAPNGQWVDVQAVTIDGRESVRVRRYRPAMGTSGRIIPGSSLSLDDVKEASRKVSSLALEAALVETNAGYDLTSQKLVDLDTAGVSDTVIDLIVALSYPEKFVIERTSRATSSTSFISDPFSLGWAFGSSVWYDDFYYSPYGYSRFGSAGPRSVFILDGSGGAISAEPQPSGTGRVVDGLGYTRVRAREPEAVATNTGVRSRTSSVSSGSAGGSSSSSSGSSSSGSSSGSSGGATSGGGYSSGSSSGDTGRTAQPR
jgi:hypothetical protein